MCGNKFLKNDFYCEICDQNIFIPLKCQFCGIAHKGNHCHFMLIGEKLNERKN